MALFYSIQAVFYTIVFLVYVTVCGFGCVVLRHLSEKGKSHYRTWVLPGTIGNAAGALLSLFSLGHILMHIRPTVTFYYVLWAGEGIVAFTAVYAVVRLWQSVRSAPFVPNSLAPSRPTEATASIWPPPPKPPQ